MQRQALLERIKPTMWIGKSGHALCTHASHGVAAPLGAHRSQAELGQRRTATAGTGHVPSDGIWEDREGRRGRSDAGKAAGGDRPETPQKEEELQPLRYRRRQDFQLRERLKIPDIKGVNAAHLIA